MLKKFMHVLAVVAIAVLAASFAVPAWAIIPDKVPDVTLYGIDGSEETLNGTYGGTNRIVIVANLCDNAQSTVKQAAELSQKPDYAGINFLILGSDVRQEQFTGEYAGYESNNLRLFYKDADYYFNWGYNVYRMDPTYDDIHLFVRPFVFLIDENDNVRFVDQNCVPDIPALIETYFGIADPDYTTVNVRGYVDTNKGMELLPLVNEARAAVGAPELAWDADLAETAIQRSMEIAVFFRHWRPDNTSCTTAWPAWASSFAENIARGQTSTEQVNESWTNSEGHYANMIDPEMVSFAAALYINDAGEYFWVECFSGEIGPNGADTTTCGSMTRTVPIYLPDHYLAVYWRVSEELEVGDTLQFDGTTIGSADLAAPVAWSSSDPSVATVSDAGLVTAVSPGTAAITAVLTDNPKLTDTITVTVEKKTISSASISLGADAFTYTGSPICPSVTVMLGGTALREGIDYSVSYSDNVLPGVAYAKVTGLGNFRGVAQKQFTIVKPNLSAATLTIENQTYTGEELCPLPTVVLDGKTLDAGVDFEVYYENNVRPGTTTVTVWGIGNYEGSQSVNFEIAKASVAGAMVSADNVTYTGKPLTPEVTVMLDNKTLDPRNDYTVEYNNNTEVGTATFTVKGAGNYTGTVTGSFTISAVLHAPGWANEGGAWYYYGNDGKPMPNHWESYGGSWYYFGSDGKLVVNGFAPYGNATYYMGSNGKFARNTWAVVGGKYYYIGSNYQPVKSGWVYSGGAYYYMDANGNPQVSGWVYYAGKYYYLRNFNPVTNEWVLYEGTYYHFNGSGVCDGTWKAS